VTALLSRGARVSGRVSRSIRRDAARAPFIRESVAAEVALPPPKGPCRIAGGLCVLRAAPQQKMAAQFKSWRENIHCRNISRRNASRRQVPAVCLMRSVSFERR